MRSADARPVAEGGDGPSARPMLAADRDGYIARHELWSERQYAAAGQMRRVIDELGLELIRFSFADQHGVLRGKTLTRDAVPAALRSGVTAPSSLLLKDTSGKTVFPVFAADTGVGVRGFAGAGDVVLVPDPTTFRVLPWAERTGWILCDVRFPSGAAVPFCTRGVLRTQLDALAAAGYDLTVGVELEFHVYRAAEGMSARHVGRPGAPGLPREVSPVSSGSQLLHEEGLDRLDDLVQLLHRGLTGLDLPLRSLELEFGPNQLELTLHARDAARSADDVMLARAAVRQISRRHGYHATFMSRPAGAETASTGWHLHQSLRDRATGTPAFDPELAQNGAGPLSPLGRHYLGGLLEHARAATVFTTPTVNGYKRYLPFSLAPDRVVWGADNKGAMVRAVGGPTGTRLENRSGEPAANPYLYIASQIVSGMDGLARGLDPGPPVEDPYDVRASGLPRSLAEALDALDADPVFARSLGEEVVSWYAALKRAEFARYLAHVSDWEQREYFDLI
ncbi:glutamine synthetase family protein [Nonomuraea sp. NEAU-A123]|uniref:glutamine synthetase family protein n=1 Tax=Nonomuraea sp. NEAU-A123 TaxID=2839649 RepID=UPI001BE48417|nr:glutamine synthetase family protein [Nonomuraea sp. NEAU-A123]MBT2227859.1 glutamine synthetase family protein [Nonomuraea sp. NEAU-A123]